MKEVLTPIIYATNNDTIVHAPYVSELFERNSFEYSFYAYTCIKCNKKMILKWDSTSDANFVHQVKSSCKGSDDKIYLLDVKNISWNELDFECYSCNDRGCDTMIDGCPEGNCLKCSFINKY